MVSSMEFGAALLLVCSGLARLTSPEKIAPNSAIEFGTHSSGFMAGVSSSMKCVHVQGPLASSITYWKKEENPFTSLGTMATSPPPVWCAHHPTLRFITSKSNVSNSCGWFSLITVMLQSNASVSWTIRERSNLVASLSMSRLSQSVKVRTQATLYLNHPDCPSSTRHWMEERYWTCLSLGSDDDRKQDSLQTPATRTRIDCRRLGSLSPGRNRCYFSWNVRRPFKRYNLTALTFT